MLRKNILFLLILSLSIILIGCTLKVDYSEYPFADKTWTRETEHDIENIRFTADGSFDYWCACGNPVMDSDISDGYTYDDKTKTITVKYLEPLEDTVSKIKIVKCDDESIELEVDGEILVFKNSQN